MCAWLVATLGADSGLMTTSNDVVLPVALATIGLAGSGIVAVAALLGVRMTIRGELNRERERSARDRDHWLSELKLASYADLIRAADDFRKAATDFHQADTGDEVEQGLRFEEQSHLLDRAASRVNLVGSTALQVPLHALVLHGFISISNILEGKMEASDEQWQEALDRYYKLYDELVNAARNDLGLEPLPRPVDLANQ
jgi:hypothetical protein